MQARSWMSPSAPLAAAQSAGVSALAHRTIEGRAAGLDDAPDGAGAARRRARLALMVIDPEAVLESAERAVGLAVVAQRRAAGLDRLGQNLADRGDEALGAGRGPAGLP